MGGRERTRASGPLSPGPSLLIVVPLLLAFALVPSTGYCATIVARLGPGTTEGLRDQDKDGLAEFLVLFVDIEVFEPGTFGVHGSTDDGKITANAGPLDLPVGRSNVELRFSGSGISNFHRGGRISFDLEVFSRDPSVETVKGSYTTTRSYAPEDFEAPSAGTGVLVRVQGQEVLIESKVMSLSINQTEPQLTFSYTGAKGSSTKASVRYLEVVAFDDTNGNGLLDPGTDTISYDSPLSLVDWKLRTDFSLGYDISLYGVIPLRLSGSSTAVAWAKITFTYRSMSLIDEGVAQKFDIDLELWQALDADHLAIVHELVDLSGEQRIVEGAGTSIQSMDENILRLVTGKDRTNGLYSWTNDISVGALSPETPARATSDHIITGDRASVTFCYPLTNGTLYIHHDPVIGMDPEHVPRLEEKSNFLKNRPLAMFMGLSFGVLLVLATVLYRSVSDRRPPKAERKSNPGGGD